MGKLPRRVLVIGLDGGTFDLMKPWMAAGYLPNLAHLVANGCSGYLASTVQPTTAPAWSTFMTGVNQGKHGLYDFVQRRAGEYSLLVTNGSWVRAPTILDIVGRNGGYSVSVNVPYTYPPRPVEGVVIAGPFVPAVSRDLVYPSSRFDMLRDVVPDYFVLADYDSLARDPLMSYANQLRYGIELRERLILHLLRTEPWDLFMAVFVATDQAQHAFWHCQDAAEGDRLARYRHVIRDIYRRVDQAIGAILAQVAAGDQERETTVIVMSDHGAGPLRWMVNLNQWLAQAGYLCFHADGRARFRTTGVKLLTGAYRRYVPAGLRRSIRTRLGAKRFDRIKGDLESTLLTLPVDWQKTRAYALGAGGNIFINLQGREPAGPVQPGNEYENVREKISEALSTIRDPDSGRPAVKRVYRREELYTGPFVDQAPDLVIEWNDYGCWGRGRYDSQGTDIFEVQRRFDLSQVPLSGSHRPYGILILNGPGVLPGTSINGARIVDLGPTILGLMGLPASEYMDGHILRAAFAEAAIKCVANGTGSMVGTQEEPRVGYTSEEAAEVSDRLKGLGYL